MHPMLPPMSLVQVGSAPEGAARRDGRTVNETAVPAGAVAVDQAASISLITVKCFGAS